MTMATQDVVCAIIVAGGRTDSISSGLDALNMICGGMDNDSGHRSAICFIVDKLAEDVEAIRATLAGIQGPVA
jgi:hypothetical protein